MGVANVSPIVRVDTIVGVLLLIIMACTNSQAHRFLLPSVVPKLGLKTPMAYESWVDTTMQTEIAPLPLKGSVCILGQWYVLPQGMLMSFVPVFCL